MCVCLYTTAATAAVSSVAVADSVAAAVAPAVFTSNLSRFKGTGIDLAKILKISGVVTLYSKLCSELTFGEFPFDGFGLMFADTLAYSLSLCYRSLFKGSFVCINLFLYMYRCLLRWVWIHVCRHARKLDVVVSWVSFSGLFSCV